MTLTPTQLAWADAQIGNDSEAVLYGIITEHSGDEGNYTMEVTGIDGTATFFLVTDDENLANKHVGVNSSVKINGEVTSVVLDEANGRVGLVITADNGTVTEWHVPEMSASEIEQTQLTPEQLIEEKAEQDIHREQTVSDAYEERKKDLLELLTDPEVKSLIGTL